MTPRLQLLSRRPRRGLTLVEILVAAAISLIVILSVVQLFKHSGDIVAEGRATIEMAGQIRRAANQVRDDLSGLTVPTKPWSTDAAAEGYLEIYEGALQWDGVTIQDSNPGNDVYGDLDDALMFTARSDARPFVGRFNNNTIESNLAEIILWPVFNSSTGESLLYRRVLLIRPDLGGGGALGGWSGANNVALYNFYNENDVSVRIDRSNGNLYPNSLADLTKRENRTLHVPNPATLATSNGYPFPLDTTLLGGMAQTGIFAGHDVLLGHVTSFDVKVYDVNAVIRQDTATGQALEPSDPGYNLTISDGSQTSIGPGAFVDLGYGNNYKASAGSRFSSLPHAKSLLTPVLTGGYTYCTWSSHYERDGVNQDGDGVTDEGTDGLDNDNSYGVDDGGELETSPPYPYSLRAVQIKIRVLDIKTQNVRQITVEHDFLRE